MQLPSLVLCVEKQSSTLTVWLEAAPWVGNKPSRAEPASGSARLGSSKLSKLDLDAAWPKLEFNTICSLGIGKEGVIQFGFVFSHLQQHRFAPVRALTPQKLRTCTGGHSAFGSLLPLQNIIMFFDVCFSTQYTIKHGHTINIDGNSTLLDRKCTR